MIPSAKIESRESEPPLNTLSRPRTPLAEQPRDGRGIDPRRRDPRPEPVDRQHPGGEQHPAPELRDPPGVGEPGEQATPRLPALPGPAPPPRPSYSVGSSSSLSRSASALAGPGRFFARFFSFGSLSSVSVPPAASTFSRAVAEAPCTVIESFLVSSPTPSSLTSLRIERIRPFAFRLSGVTSSPASKRSRSRMFTGWV